MDRTRHHDHAKDEPSNGDGSAIARQLTGELFCIGCGYNLRGLSIRANCSECGMPVRATILGIVDPHADELEPLYFPRLAAIGLNVWSLGAMLAVLMVWVLRLAEVMRDLLSFSWAPTYAPWIGICGLGVSMLGGIAIIRPHRNVHRFDAVRAAIGISLYAPLIFVYQAIYNGYDSVSPSPLLDPGASMLDRSVLRLGMFVLVAGVIWGMRPQALGLAVRSVVIRTGRVDRQSLWAVLASLGMAAFGDLIHVVSVFTSQGISDVLSIISIVVISLGSVLFGVGMFNICIDTIRLYPVLVRPGVGLSDIFETNTQKTARTDKM